jgi:hypothetical protein
MSTMHTAEPFPASPARPGLGHTLAVVGGALAALVALAASARPWSPGPFRLGR